MANYAKRDARAMFAAALSDGADQRRREAEAKILRCWCGEVAVIAFYPLHGPNRLFCDAHQAEAYELANQSNR